MVGKHLAQHAIDFVAGIPRRQRRLRAGDLLAHPREVREVAISQRMVQQFSALLGAGARRADDM